MRHTWPPKHIECLRKFALESMTAKEAAAELNKRFGTSYTKNSVVGVGHRKKIVWASKPVAKRWGLPPRLVVNNTRAVRAVRAVRAAPPEPKIDPFDASQIPHKQRRKFLDLNNNHCRYPYGTVGQKGFFFCGSVEADNARGVPYCRAHSRIAYHAR